MMMKIENINLMAEVHILSSDKRYDYSMANWNGP